MSCYKPLHAYARFDENTGKRKLIFAQNHDHDHLIKDFKVYDEKLLIPCGQCIGCRLDYSRHWATRCVLESMEYANNYFVTLTYDELHVPYVDNACVDCRTGEVYDEFESLSLVPEHLTKFMKDLRAYCSYHYNWDNIRFYACGEYGSETHRPHYHLILFNMPDLHALNDLSYYRTNHEGSVLYNSKILDKVWQNGYSVVGEVNYNTCAYVARYMLKKHKGKDFHFYEDHGLVPEFTRCSRRPGIGKTYYEKNKDNIYQFDEIILPGRDGAAMRVKVPGYYDRLYDIDNPEDLKRLKEKRKESGLNRQRQILEHTSLSYDEYLALQEGNKLNQASRLYRSLKEDD